MNKSRRKFIKNTTLGSVGLTLGARHLSFGNILGANDRIRLAVMGVNSRGRSLARNFARQENTEIVYICDVDQKALDRCVSTVEEIQGNAPKGIVDFRQALDDPDVDGLVIAAPDHWHAPAAIMGCQAGKNVYVEKPCSHNPKEGELLVYAARKYKKVVQMGTQRRSWPIIIRGIKELHDGRIGKVYFAKAWYANKRGPIGYGKVVPVPENLNYELWQGPAPRKPYKDNLIHYNWHWFWHWGTGEALNNGTHELDMVRWGLNVDYALRVNSSGGRYHYEDDWETPDTQIISYDFTDGKSAIWEGRSCNNRPVEGSGRGVVFYGTEGSMITDGGHNYKVFNKKNELVEDVNDKGPTDALNTTGPGSNLDAFHLNNFLDAIREGKTLTAEIETGFKSVLLCQLGNIAWRTGKTLNLDQSNGHILDNPEAMKLWSRDYEPGWEPKV